MSELDKHSRIICDKLLNDLIEVSQGDSSIKFFRRDLITMLVWLFIMDAYAKKNK